MRTIAMELKLLLSRNYWKYKFQDLKCNIINERTVIKMIQSACGPSSRKKQSAMK